MPYESVYILAYSAQLAGRGCHDWKIRSLERRLLALKSLVMLVKPAALAIRWSSLGISGKSYCRPPQPLQLFMCRSAVTTRAM